VIARWTKAKGAPSFHAVIKITGVEDIGIGNKIADILSDYSVTVRNFSYGMNEGIFEGTLSIMVPNNDVLYGIIRRISSVRGVIKAVRHTSEQN